MRWAVSPICAKGCGTVITSTCTVERYSRRRAQEIRKNFAVGSQAACCSLGEVSSSVRLTRVSAVRMDLRATRKAPGFKVAGVMLTSPVRDLETASYGSALAGLALDPSRAGGEENE